MRNLTPAERVVVDGTTSSARRAIFDVFSASFGAIVSDARRDEPALSSTGLSDGPAGALLTGSLIASLAENARSPFTIDDVPTAPVGGEADTAPASLLFGAPGLAYARASLHARSATPSRGAPAVEAFLQSCAAVRGVDVYGGRSGVLLGCVSLFRLAKGAGDPTALVLRTSAAAHAAAIVDELDATPIDDLNFAHGLAGALYALLEYVEAFEDRRIVAFLRTKVRALAAELHFGADGRPAWSMIQPWAPASLCNGSSGQLLLAVEALGVLDEDLFGDRLAQLTASAATFGDLCPHLCCGLAGQAFALMTAYRSIGDAALLQRSLKLVEAAAIGFTRETPDFSLFRGYASVAWYTACLDAGVLPAIPFLEL